MATYASDMGATSITEDITDPSGRVDTIESDIQAAREEYVSTREQTAQAYLDVLNTALSRVQSLLDQHGGKPYMNSDLESRLQSLKSTINGEITQTKSELETIRNV